MSAPILTLIVAKELHSGIGYANQLPWHLPEDLAHFKKTTLGHTILMGRNTFTSIGRPLPGRTNFVLSRTLTPAALPDAVQVFADLPKALAACTGTQLFIIGGADLYRQTLPLAHRLIVTEIDAHYPCDAFFPSIPQTDWLETARETHHAKESALRYSFVTYLRK